MHMAYELERLYDGNRLAGQYVWAIDFSGFGLRDCSAQMAATGIKMFLDHYPERMGQIVLVDPPRICEPSNKVHLVAVGWRGG